MEATDYSMNRPIVIIGSPRTAPVEILSSYWRSQGEDILIVTRKWKGENALPNGSKIISSYESESISKKRMLKYLKKVLSFFEKVMQRLYNRGYRQVLEEEHYNVSFTKAIINALSVASCVRRLKPRFVFGMEAFKNGLSTALCFGIPRLLMVWGHDVYVCGFSSPFSYRMVRFSLNHVDRVTLGSEIAAKFIIREYDIDPSKVQVVHWGISKGKFHRADAETRNSTCSDFGIDPNSLIISNIRRFRPDWGSDRVLEAFIDLAKSDDSSRFIILGGANSEKYINDAVNVIEAHGFRNRFLIFDNEVSYSEYSRLLSITDIAVSVSLVDIGSSSVLEAAASSCPIVLSDRDEYRQMVAKGFSALLVNPKDKEEILNGIQMLINDKKLSQRMVLQNNSFLEQSYVFSTQMELLAASIDEVSKKYI